MVVDTMVFAYALLGVPQFREEASAVLARVDRVDVPDILHAELANVAWQGVRAGHVDASDALDMLDAAAGLVDEATASTVLWHDALMLSVDRNHPVYDTLFVALAAAKATRVVTYDLKMRRRFPEWTVSPTDLLSA